MRSTIKLIAVIFCLAVPSVVSAQKIAYKGFPSLIWPKLYDISFVKATDSRGAFEKPVFTEAVKALRDKSIVLPGYMVPLENEKKNARIMLSSLPLNACFFCGVGGPETVVEVHLNSETTYIEEPIEVKGILRLNDTDPDKLIYVLEQAEILGVIEL